MPRLVLLSEGFAGRTFDLKTETTTVGRVSDNAFEIPEASVSSHHAEIVVKGSDVLIRDLESTNGTFINGERITEAVLKPGQILRFGTIELKLDTGDAPVKSTPPPKAASKPKTFDHTVVIPQGVKLEDLQGGGAPPGHTTGFEPRSDRGNKIFAIFVIIAGACLIGALVWVAIIQFR